MLRRQLEVMANDGQRLAAEADHLRPGIGLWRGKKWAEYLTIGVTASLLLNLEALFTVLLARVVWREASIW